LAVSEPKMACWRGKEPRDGKLRNENGKLDVVRSSKIAD
jgi:hypothetical protein